MINSIDEILLNVKNVGITGHVRPDGDCVGSTLGLYNYICDNYKNIEATVYLEEFEKCFSFINGSDKVLHDCDNDKKHDVFIILDCGDINRVANFIRPVIMNADKTVCIDHHTCNLAFADINHVLPDLSSTCEALYELLDSSKISKNTAEALYTGIIHDTGVLKYQCTTKRTMEIAGELMSKGIDYTSIIDDTFFRKTYIQNYMLGLALINSRLVLDGKLIYSYLPYDVLSEHNVPGRDLGGIIDQLRFTEGVEVALFMYELPDHAIKGSLRSVDKVDVNIIANCFGGGGHVRAAGFTAGIPYEEVVKKVITELKKQVEKCITE